MPIQSVGYVRRPYASDNGRIGDLLRRRGDLTAQALLRGGDVQAQLWSRIGQIGQGAVNDYVTEQREAPIRADQARLRSLNLQKAEQEAAEPARLAKQDEALGQAIVDAMSADGELDPRPFVSIAGPKRGLDIATGLHEFRALSSGKVETPQQSAVRIGAAFKALKTQELQQMFWPQVKAAAVKAGLVTPEQFPDAFSAEIPDALIAWGSGKAPDAPTRQKVERRNADGSTTIEFVDPQTAGPITSAPLKADTEWVTRGGQAVQIPKGTAQAGDRPYQPPSQAQGPQPSWQWVNRGGTPVHTNRPEPGDEPLRAPQNTGDTAQDRQRNARTTAARDFLARLNELRTKINTKMGPAAGLTGLARRGGAKMGMDPDVSEYERIRAAGGRALAVAIMGAQNLSDADANAWANMLPDALTDEQTAGRLTTQVEAMLNGMTGSGPAAQPAQASQPAQTDDADFDYVPGKGLVPRRK